MTRYDFLRVRRMILSNVRTDLSFELGLIIVIGRYYFLGPISHPVVKRWLLKPASCI